MGRKKTPQEENETQQHLIQATLDVIAEKGIDAATARAIADRAGVNQALVFYYFGSVTNLVVQAVTQMSGTRYELYKSQLGKCETLQELATTFFQIFEEDREDCSFQVLSQFVSGARNNEEIASAVDTVFTSWVLLTQDCLERTLGEISLPNDLDITDISIALVSMLLGVQFLASIPGYEQKVGDSLEKMKQSSALLGLLPMLLQSFKPLD